MVKAENENELKAKKILNLLVKEYRAEVITDYPRRQGRDECVSHESRGHTRSKGNPYKHGSEWTFVTDGEQTETSSYDEQSEQTTTIYVCTNAHTEYEVKNFSYILEFGWVTTLKIFEKTIAGKTAITIVDAWLKHLSGWGKVGEDYQEHLTFGGKTYYAPMCDKDNLVEQVYQSL